MIDFRSDTVTRPSADMKQAMMDAPLGDDVMGDDPTVLLLQEMAADRLGFEAGLFAPSGTQTNLIALMVHCQRGQEAIVGQQWHTYRWEAGGMAVLGSIQPQPLENQADGTIALDDIESAIKPDDPHFASTRLIVTENTNHGKALPMAYMQSVRQLADKHGLQTHLDGARLFNAATELAIGANTDTWRQAKEICRSYDSVSVCLSKGLGAPVGSLLLGPKPFIERAKRVRKMLGGAMRQSGLLAAAGIYALDNNVEKLAEDHANAVLLANGLQDVVTSHSEWFGRCVVQPAVTNMVFIDMPGDMVDAFVQYMSAQRVNIKTGYQRTKDKSLKRLRWVTHLDISRADIMHTIDAVAGYRGHPQA